MQPPPSSRESLSSIKDARTEILWEIRWRPHLDTSELEDALQYADQYLWRIVETLRENAYAAIVAPER